VATHNARARLAAAPDVALPDWVRREVSRVLPELREGEVVQPIQSEADRLNYFLAHLEVVRLTGQGVAAVISDDVQHYDPATVELGAFFLTQSLPLGQRGDVPRHIILYRQGALPPLTQQRIDALVRSGMAAHIDLGGLDGRSVTALLDELGITGPSVLAQELHDWTGGNPQHLLEAVRHMHLSGEYSVDAALRERARGAAVLGDAFTLERLSEVLRLGLLDLTAAWEELEAAQVVSGERFSHDTVREAVLASVHAPVRTLLHRACARVLAGAPVHPARVARHWAEAGDPGQAAPWFLRAAETALQTLRPEEAGAYYDEAAAARAAGDPDGVCPIHLNCATGPEAHPGGKGTGARYRAKSATALTLDDLLVLWQSPPQLSLRRFAQYASVLYWRLRDHQHSAQARCARQQQRDEVQEKIRQVALHHPTAGYRLLYHELKAQGEEIGLHKVRVALGELHLHPPQPRKTRKPSPKVSAPQDWPEGQRVQIDATRLSLSDGVCWIDFVLDVPSRVVLASCVVRSLSMHLAKWTLDEAMTVLSTLGIAERILVQSDGGSDFTSDLFQQACLTYGRWVRCKVSQPGGTGILERLNRTFKYQFAFRQDWHSMADVRAAMPDFHRWYNYERRHSALGYATPWSTLTSSANARNAA
jgi:transposase InsO family protein